MSLLPTGNDAKTVRIAQAVFDRHFTKDPKLNQELDDRRKMLMYQDILYNLSFLDAAVSINDSRLFSEYAIWLYQLLCSLMKDLDRDRIRDQMVVHYQTLLDVLEETSDPDKIPIVAKIINEAIEATRQEVVRIDHSPRFNDGSHVGLRKSYLDKLLTSDTRGALKLMRDAVESGVSLPELYQDVLQEVMYEVGSLWHQNIITVDKEHYCTSTTQMAISQFYPLIFSRPRNGRKIITCSVGSELHEMGIRMLSDLFEYQGWDSIYLGAAVPPAAILTAVKEHQPDLIGLSVTMPQYLPLCLEVVRQIRDYAPGCPIAVGGRAFTMTDRIWEKWPIDIYAENADTLLQWSESTLGNNLETSR